MGATCYYYDGDRYSTMSASICDKQDPTCNGENNGYATVCVSGSAGPYNFSWDHGDTDSLATGLSDGTYSVTVTDANGCQPYVLSVNISEPSPLNGDITDTVMVSCKGECDGEAEVPASGGTGSYSYSWNNGQSTRRASNLCAGTYTVRVTDDNGCEYDHNITITEPPNDLTANINSSTNVTCYGACDGTADGLVSGGTSPYTYVWTDGNGDTASFAEDPSSFCAGTYTFTVTDTNGCSDWTTVNITQPDSLTVLISRESDGGGCDGEGDAAASGGAGCYSYEWIDTGGNIISTDDEADDICDTAEYTVVVTDCNGCTDTVTTSLSANVTVSYNCDGTCPDASAVVSGGFDPYVYVWTDTLTGDTVSTISSAACLSDGGYQLKVTDDKDDIFKVNFNISNTYPLSATISDSVMVSCEGICDGEAEVTATGGKTPYSYLWENGQISKRAGGICPDNDFDVTVTDVNGCTVDEDVNITAPQIMTINSTSVTDVNCYGACDGTVSINSISGGTAPYTYTWINANGDTAGSSSAAADLCKGDYTAIVKDSNGCVNNTTSLSVSEPDSLKIIPSVSNTSCIGEPDGSASASVTGGTGNYSCSWVYRLTGTVHDTVNPSADLYDGGYDLEVTDDNNCTKTSAVNIGSNENAYCPDTIYVGASGRLILEWTDNIRPACMNSVWVDLNNSGNYLNYPGSNNGTTKWRSDSTDFIAITDTTDVYIANSRCLFSGDGGLVLPVNLLSFYGEQESEKVTLHWSIASKPIAGTNYIIERSASGKNFLPVGDIKAAPDKKYFKLNDKDPETGVNYYRVKVVKKDPGNRPEYSKIISVLFKKNVASSNMMHVYPNPVMSGQRIFFEFPDPQNEEILITLKDIYGRVVFSKIIINEKDKVLTAVDPQNKVKKGTYYIIGSSDNKILDKKILVIQ